jgi:hypothetical protein
MKKNGKGRAYMKDSSSANGFWWKSLGDRDHLEALGPYGWITLSWVFRLIQIIHMTLGQQSGKNLITEEPNGL